MSEETEVVELEGPPPEREKRERGQSLVEYTILLTWTCLAMIAIIHGVGTATKGVWSTTNSELVLANQLDH